MKRHIFLALVILAMVSAFVFLPGQSKAGPSKLYPAKETPEPTDSIVGIADNDTEHWRMVLFPPGAFARSSDIAVTFWYEDTDYVVNQHVSHNGYLYYARQNHTSDATGVDVNEPGTGSDWDTYWGYASDPASSSYEIALNDTRVRIVDLGGGNEQLQVVIEGDEEPYMTWDIANGLQLPPMSSDSTITGTGKFSLGPNSTVIVGETVAAGKVVAIGLDDEYYLADANDTNLYPAMGISVGAASIGADDLDDSSADDGEPILLMTHGRYVDASWAWAPKDKVCLSETPGELVVCTDSSLYDVENDCSQWVGTAETSTKVYFDFSRVHMVRGAD